MQPIDLTVNAQFKKLMREKFISWYAEEIVHLEDLNEPVDLRLTLVKPLHASWLMDTMAELMLCKDLVTSGFEKAGILETITDCPSDLASTVSADSD